MKKYALPFVMLPTLLNITLLWDTRYVWLYTGIAPAWPGKNYNIGSLKQKQAVAYLYLHGPDVCISITNKYIINSVVTIQIIEDDKLNLWN